MPFVDVELFYCGTWTSMLKCGTRAPSSRLRKAVSISKGEMHSQPNRKSQGGTNIILSIIRHSTTTTRTHAPLLQHCLSTFQKPPSDLRLFAARVIRMKGRFANKNMAILFQIPYGFEIASTVLGNTPDPTPMHRTIRFPPSLGFYLFGVNRHNRCPYGCVGLWLLVMVAMLQSRRGQGPFPDAPCILATNPQLSSTETLFGFFGRQTDNGQCHGSDQERLAE